jgi:hypothetical protein
LAALAHKGLHAPRQLAQRIAVGLAEFPDEDNRVRRDPREHGSYTVRFRDGDGSREHNSTRSARYFEPDEWEDLNKLFDKAEGLSRRVADTHADTPDGRPDTEAAELNERHFERLVQRAFELLGDALPPP